MSETWAAIYADHGPSCVVRPGISDALLADETERQSDELAAILGPHLDGAGSAIDFGSGCGRFVPLLRRLVGGPVVAFEPCAEMRARIAYGDLVLPVGRLGNIGADLVFCFCVLGDPAIDPDAAAAEIARVTNAGALIVICDHMPDRPPGERWWRFRSESFYVALFARLGIVLGRLGGVMQLKDEVTILAGHNP